MIRIVHVRYRSDHWQTGTYPWEDRNVVLDGLTTDDIINDVDDYLKALADSMQGKPVRIVPPQGGSGTAPPSWKQ